MTDPAMIRVLIPAYNPEPGLPGLVRELFGRGFNSVLVVDDGSRPACAAVFAAAAGIPRCAVVRHERNRGKGCALKTGFQHLSREDPAFPALLTVDADGQHLPADCRKVAERWTREPAGIVLGVRQFPPTTPFRSRLGNGAMRATFRLLTGTGIQDTQTGLRAIPRALLPELLRLPGERYEYEMAMLLHASWSGIGLVEEPITTVYQNGNASSHFRPLLDSLRVCAVLGRFALRWRRKRVAAASSLIS